MAVSLGGGHLLRERLLIVLVAHPCEALAVELVEADAVVSWVISRSSTAQTSDRQLCSPGKRAKQNAKQGK